MIKATIRYILVMAATYGFMSAVNALYPQQAAPHPYLIALLPLLVVGAWLGPWEALASLLVVAGYIFYFSIPPLHSAVLYKNELLPWSLFVAQGLIVVWIVYRLKQAQARLAAALRQREDELIALRQVYEELADSSSKTRAQLMESNTTMTSLLEQILENHIRRGR